MTPFPNSSHASEEEDDDSALLEALEASVDSDPSLGAYRAQRREQLHAEVARAKQLREQSHDTYGEMKEEKALMDVVTETKWCVVHFFKPGFGRCAVMDEHLKTLSTPHIQTRFLRINVENAPFLVTKLQIQVLPCVIAFVDGIIADRIIGFEGLSKGPPAHRSKSKPTSLNNSDDDGFSTKSLESRLVLAGVLVGEKDLGGDWGGGGGGDKKTTNTHNNFHPKKRGLGKREEDENEDDDEDDEWD